MRWWIVALIVAFAPPVWAETRKEKAAAAYAEGQRHYKAKDYVKAAERFKAAFAADEDPVYLFNIAQSLRLAKQCTESRDYYKKFIAAAGASLPNRDKVEKSLAEVEACAAKEKPKDVDPKPVDPKSDDPKPVDPPKAADAPPKPIERPMPNPGRSRRMAGIGLIALGAVATGVGVLMTTQVGSLEREREGLCPDPCTWDDTLALREADLDTRGRRAATFAITSFAVGGAAILGGVMLYVTGRSVGKERVAVTPVAGGAVARVGFTF